MFDTKMEHRLGNDNFVWFYGVVEDIKDPLKLGRLRVRILGDHTQSKKENRIPTESLPWAYPISGINSASMNGIGKSPTGIGQGSWVFGFYADSMDKQQPMILGSFGGIPEAICWNPKKLNEDGDYTNEEKEVQIGFMDPDKKFPMGHMIFEQDNNRLSRGVIEGAIEVPEKIVPPQEKECDDGLCPSDPKLALQYHDKFDEQYVKKYAKGDKEAKVEKKDDKQPQYKLKNNHPFTVFKFVKRERRIPIAKPFADPVHREEWHEPQNPYAAKYPYNNVTEYTHGEGSEDIYGYDQTITNYDGSEKEGLHRKQKCGEGAWGLGEEWDTTEGKNRYHRFHPKGNYYEIDEKGNEVRKIYGDSFEIDLKDRSILIKGDWNVTVEGNKNELIEGDYNLQIMGNFNTDVRGNIETHCDNDNKEHYKGNNEFRVDGNDDVLIVGNRNTTVLVKDFTESQEAERHANIIIRKGATSIEDEGFMTFDLKAHEMNINVCNMNTKIDTHKEIVETYDGEFKMFEVKIEDYTAEFNEYQETREKYEGWIRDYTLHTDDYLLTFFTSYETRKEAYIPPTPQLYIFPYVMETELGKTTYCNTECLDNQCKPKYNDCVEAAKGASMVTLVDPRTGQSNTRVDWEKYHATIEKCKKSYDDCVDSCECGEQPICNPSEIGASWNNEPPTGEKKVKKGACGSKPTIEDPFKNMDQEKP